MSLALIWSVLLPLLVASYATADLPIYDCQMQEDYCVFTGVQLNETDFRFMPYSPRPGYIKKVRFFHNDVPVFAADICNTFRHLEILEVYYSKTERITEDAFESCPNLTRIDFRYHNIEKFESNIFQNTKKLNFIRFDNGKLNQLQLSLFDNLRNLSILSLANNKLNRFPARLVADLTNLTELWLYSNEIADLDERKLAENMPSLQKIYFNDNDFRCDRVETIVKEFRDKGVEGFSFMTLRKRGMHLEKVEDIECLTTDQWNLINNEKGWDFKTDKDTSEESARDFGFHPSFDTMSQSQVHNLCSRYCSKSQFP